MPSLKKRINLTVPDDIYNRIQSYKSQNGIDNDAGACLQLIVQQLNSIENSKKVMDLIAQFSAEQLAQISQDGFATIKQLNDSAKNKL